MVLEMQTSMSPAQMTDSSQQPQLRLFRPDNPASALGIAVNHLMTKPAFANLRFGDWSRILVGQINRRHYCFVVDDNREIRGFVGWALTSRENAEAWVEGRRSLSYEDSKAGDCVIINAWSADDGRVHRLLLDATRKLTKDKHTIYFKRHYGDGSTRPVRLNVNDFVVAHLSRNGKEHDPGRSPNGAAYAIPHEW
jgi:hemolysin-activating ACP:hemolysin acyltransferase